MSSCGLVDNMTETAELTPSAWYAVHTRSKHEKRIATDLKLRGVSTFLPLVTEVHKWSDRQQKVEVPLFSCYVFVNLPTSSESRVAVLRTPGVISLLGGNHHGTPIPDSQIENIQTLLARKIPFASHAFLEIGQKIRVCAGPMKGIEGILTRWNGGSRLVISVETIQRSLSVSVDGYEVELVEQSGGARAHSAKLN